MLNIKKNIHSYILGIVMIVLFIMPIMNIGNNFIVGGDDMKLHYIYPHKYLTNFTFNLSSDNTLAGAMTGYTSVAYFAPFYISILVIKFLLPFLNTQAVMYGLNFSLGFYFMTKVLGLLLASKDYNKYYPIIVITGLLYVFSPYLNGTLYSHQLLHIFLISVLPACIYFLLRSFTTGKLYELLISVLLFSVFTTTIGSAPYSVAFFIPLIPFLISRFYQNLGLNVKNILVAFIIFCSLNMYWMFHTVYPYVANQSPTSSISLYATDDFANDNIRIIKGVINLYNPLNIVTMNMDQGRLEKFTLFDVSKSIFIVIILFAGFVVSNKHNNKYLYISLLLSFLLSWFLFSPNIGDWGQSTFLWISNNLPLWGMFRNMYDKFAPSLAFTYALLFGISLYIVVERWSKHRNYLYIICLTIIVTFAPYTINPFAHDRFGLTRISGNFNQDFNDLTNYLVSISDVSRIVWLPLNYPTYLPIMDTESEKYYFGPSPIRILANRNDITGKFSFLTQDDLFFGDRVFDMLERHDYEAVGNTFKELNVGHIIINHDLPPSDLASFLYGGDTFPLLNNQREELTNEILGEKIQDFGERYSLYKINKSYSSDTFSVTSNDDVVDNTSIVEYKKLSSDEYLLSIKNINSDIELTFLSPFSTFWELYLVNRSSEIFPHIYNNSLSNVWEISYERLLQEGNITDQGIAAEFRLYFKPLKYTTFANAISIITLILLVIYLIIARYHNKI
jgi:hypothetical protein